MKSILSIPSIFPKVIHIHFLCFNWQFLYISYMMPSNKHLIMIWLASTREYFIHSIHIVLSIKPKKYQMFSVSFKYWHEKFARALTNSWYVHDMFNCTIKVVFIWYPELQCMVTMEVCYNDFAQYFVRLDVVM